MEKKKRRSNPGYVSIAVCTSRHEALGREVSEIKLDVEQIKNALVGADMQSGLVKTVADIARNQKSSLSGKDKAAIIGSLILALSSVAVVLLQLVM